MSKTTIEWTDYTFNPWWGCAKVSPGCKNCYAETFDKRIGGGHWGIGAPRRTFGVGYWQKPLSWDAAAAKAGRRFRVFCASMADVFDPEAPEGELVRLLDLIQRTPNLDWLLLTKRPERAREVFTVPWFNVWLGTSVESQKYMDERVPQLLATPATVRFLSCEPLLEPVTLPLLIGALDWVIVGGESGPEARPFNPSWARSLVNQCRGAGIAPFVKQMGQNWNYDANAALPRPKRMREIHGRDMAEWPEDIRVREWPKPADTQTAAHDATLDRGAADSDGPRSGGGVGGGAAPAAGGAANSDNPSIRWQTVTGIRRALFVLWLYLRGYRR